MCVVDAWDTLFLTEELSIMPDNLKKLNFETTIEKFSTESGWHYLFVEKEIAEMLKFTGKSRRVVCTINGSETFQCALMPYKGNFFIIVNQNKRKKLKVEAGDVVSVELTEDHSRYGLPMPEDFREVLDQDPEGDRLFHSLTAGKQRSILYHIGKVKDIDKRIDIGLIFLEHLKNNNGKIIPDELVNEIKQRNF